MIAIGILAAYFLLRIQAKSETAHEHVLSGGMEWWEDSWAPRSVLDYRMEKYPGKSWVSECYSD